MANHPKRNARRAGLPTSLRPAGQLRDVIYEVVTPSRMHAVIDTICTQAEEGNLSAAKLLVDRCLGAPVETDMMERVALLEQHLRKLAEAAKSQQLDAGGQVEVKGYVEAKRGAPRR